MICMRLPGIKNDVLLHTHHCFENSIIERLSRVMGYVGEKTRDLGITNLTVIDILASYGAHKIVKIIFILPNISYSHNIIGVSTFNEEMTLTFHGTEDDRDRQK